MKICPVGAELFHADGQTDRQKDATKLIVAFRKFAKGPNKLVWKPLTADRTSMT